ncbi:MAG: hypothetical protein A3H42_06185 [Deltaproteobacteria bacterium RIFCSPLOWO2_02_FULL_46_8]|nr:MAG: hypothetical protein A3H42_06185 [Deltaproteobacteria bacterium RIFCSPLOWO2_02_FULL_46_8]
MRAIAFEATLFIKPPALRGVSDFKRLYITESLGSWHALANRPEVQKYLVDRYAKQQRARNYHLAITNKNSVDTIYEVP